MRKLTLSITLATVLLASASAASFAQTVTAPADGNTAGMQGMSGMQGMAGQAGMRGQAGMQGQAGGGAMPMGNMGMMPMMMAMMPMMMPMGSGSMAGMPAAPTMAQTGDQAGIDAKLNLLITSIETLTKRIDALEAKSAN